MNISSIVITTLQKNIDAVLEELKTLPNVDYHFHDELGRIIVTIEAPNVSEEVATLAKIEKLKHVMSADMSYTYAEKELEKEKALIGTQEEMILKTLEDDTDQVDYTGSVSNHLDKIKKDS